MRKLFIKLMSDDLYFQILILKIIKHSGNKFELYGRIKRIIGNKVLIRVETRYSERI